MDDNLNSDTINIDKIMEEVTVTAIPPSSTTQLQDVTLDAENITLPFPLMDGEKNRKSSPMRVQSVKEYEEELNGLMKENFSLKLRIYFLEERLGKIMSGPKDLEEALQKNIALSVENETIRKELNDNKLLLSQSLKALELMEKEQKKSEKAKEAEIQVLNEKIEELEQDLKNIRLGFGKNISSSCLDDPVEDETNELQSQVIDLQHEIKQLKRIIEEQQRIIDERDAIIDDAIRERCQEIENELDNKNHELEQLHSELNKKTIELSLANEEIVKCNKQIEEIERSTPRFCDEECHKLNQMLDNRCAHLESQVKRACNLRKTVEQQTKEIDNYRTQLMNREQMIGDLEERLSKVTCHSNILEAKYEKQQQELKRTQNDLNELKNKQSNDDQIEYHKNKIDDLQKRHRDDVQTLEDQITSRDIQIKKLQTENVRALGVIREFIKRGNAQKQNGGEFGNAEHHASLNEEITRRDKEIDSLKREIQTLKEITVLRSRDSVMTLPSQQSTTTNSRGNSARGFERMPNESSLNDNEMTDGSTNTCNLMKEYIQQIDKMEDQIQELTTIVKEKEEEIRNLQKTNEDNLEIIKTKDNRITELEEEITELKNELFELQKNLPIDSLNASPNLNRSQDVDNLRQLLESRNKEIERLEEELRKRTGNLQELVNKELWDKNREIERLQRRIRATIDERDKEIQKLRAEIAQQNQEMLEMKNTVSELNMSGSGDYATKMEQELVDLREQNKNLTYKIVENQNIVRNSPPEKEQIIKLKNEIVRLEKNNSMCLRAKQEALDMCSTLTTRLEELAMFLNSLLKEKSVLGFLGIEKQNVLRDAVEKSLDLSRTLSMSISLNADESLLQMSSVTGILDQTRKSIELKLLSGLADSENGNEHNISNITFTSLRDPLRISIENRKSSNQFSWLQDKIEALQLSTEKLERETRLSPTQHSPKNTSLTHLQTEKHTPKDKSKTNLEVEHSESEAWSEPDRSVSLARMGFVDESLKTSSPGTGSVTRSRSSSKYNRTSKSTASSSSSSLSLSDNKNLRTPQKRSSEERILSAKRNLFGDCKHNSPTLQEEVIKLQKMLKEREQEILSIKFEMIEKNEQLQTDKLKLAEQYEEIKNQKLEAIKCVNEAETKVRLADEERKRIEEKIDQLNRTVEELLNQKTQLSQELECQVKNSQIVIGNLEKERDAAVLEATEAQKRAEGVFVDIKLSEMRLTSLQNSYDHLKTQFDAEVQRKLKENEEQWTLKIQELEKDLKSKINELEISRNSMKQHYEDKYILKDIYNEKLSELEKAHAEIEKLKNALQEVGHKIRALEENEIKLVEKIQELQASHKETYSQLRRELDEATLMASQTAVERTKISSEKIRLEKQVQKLEQERNHLETELIQQKCEYSRKDVEYSQKITVLIERESELKQKLDGKETEIERIQKDLNEKQNAAKDQLLKQIACYEIQKNELELRISQLENMNADLENRLVKLQARQQIDTHDSYFNKTNTSPLQNNSIMYGRVTLSQKSVQSSPPSSLSVRDYSGYSSEDIPVNSYEILRRHQDDDRERTVNSSPDLGIESDQGRFSSLETNVNANISQIRPFLPPLEITQNMNNMLNSVIACDNEPAISVSEIQKLRNENAILKSRLMKTRKTLEDTVQQLAKSNERKKQVEKAVCKQIHKTSMVLRKARANLDSGSENDVPK